MINAIRTAVVSSPTHIHHRHNFAKPHLSQRLEDALEAACALRKNPKKRIFLQEEDEGAIFRVTTQKQIAEVFKIKEAALSKHLNPSKYLKKEDLGTGQACALGQALENELILHIGKCICIQETNHSIDMELISNYEYVYAVSLCDKGFGITWPNVQYLAMKLARANGDEDFMASNGWLYKFKRRHPNVASRVAESLERTRAGALNKDLISRYDMLFKKKQFSVGIMQMNAVLYVCTNCV